MPSFGKRSQERLRGVDSRIINVLNKVVKYFDVTVIEGHTRPVREIHK